MYFKLVETDAGFHARLFNANKQLVMWTKDHATKEAVIIVCGEIRSNMSTDTPIYDV
jgi:uncharacterized protein YegP (UPF0339 family)